MTDQRQAVLQRALACFHSCKWVISPLLFFSFFFLVSSASAQAELKVEWEGEYLSVTAEKVPLSQILQEVAQRTGVEFRGVEEAQDEVSVSFASLPLSEGLQKLLAPMNYLLLEGAVSQGGKKSVLALIFGRAMSPPPTVIISGGEEGRERALEAENEEDEEERLQALRAAAQQGNKEVLRKALSDANLTIQTTAFKLLAEQNRQEAVTFLVESTKSDQPQERLQSLQLFRQTDLVDEQTALSAFSEMVTDEDVTVKEHATQALVERGGPDAIKLLQQALQDSDPSFRRSTIELIARTLPPTQSLPLLKEAAMDGDEAVRSVASSQLEIAEEAGSEVK